MKQSLMQNDRVLLAIEYIVLSILTGVLCNDLRVFPLVRYLCLYSSFNLAARALRFIASMSLRAFGDTKRFLSFKARSPLSCEEVLYGLLTADMQVNLILCNYYSLTTKY
jgi:hypothetical protein